MNGTFGSYNMEGQKPEPEAEECEASSPDDLALNGAPL